MTLISDLNSQLLKKSLKSNKTIRELQIEIQLTKQNWT